MYEFKEDQFNQILIFLYFQMIHVFKKVQKKFQWILKIVDDFLSLWNKPNQFISGVKIIHSKCVYQRMCLYYYLNDFDYNSTIQPICNSKKGFGIWRILKGCLHCNEEKQKVLKIGQIQIGQFIVNFKESINLMIAFNIALATCELKQRIRDQ
ncbi:unnamed protein product [Paramecium primaurelia]|uniref:Uncharacterized protein n=1 Tax=Paramecium primaurelia TaxID=5886 RepID=A0A8S1QQ77_PARPR|nr:unnamed protein product [Paramecium primaurelia]